MHKAGNVQSKAPDLDASSLKVSLHMTMCSIGEFGTQQMPNQAQWAVLAAFAPIINLCSPLGNLAMVGWVLMNSWWWKFAGTLWVQTLPQEQRFSGVTHQKWALLGSKCHPCPRASPKGGVTPAQGVPLSGPWQGAVVADLSS